MLSKSFPEHSVQSIQDTYDYIIIGGGTAGCVLANRLSKDKSISVLLLERGGVSNGFRARIPLLSAQFASDDTRTHFWKSTPQSHVDNRVFDMAGGNSLGGTSKINAMLYTRGIPAEFNLWSQAGRKGWSYDELQPYFIMSEHDLDFDSQSTPDYHGLSGEWPNRSHKKTYWEHSHHIIRAASAMGIPYVEDLNSPLHPSHGCAKMHYTIDNRGERSSTLSAFLPDDIVNERKEHLHVCTYAHVHKIVVKTDSAGTARTEGVYVQATNEDSQPRLISARREVILSAGPIASPQILLLSGIGPEDHLKKHDIPVVKDLQGVGAHLQDHLAIPLQYSVPMHDSLVKLQLQPWLIVLEFILYLFFGQGLLLSPVLELSVFIQSRLFDKDLRKMSPTEEDGDASLPKNLPDIEVMPISYGDPAVCKVTGQGGLAMFAILSRPTSTGTVRLASSDPRVNPAVDPNYLATEHDRLMTRKCIKFVKQLKNRMAAQGYAITDNLVPKDNDEDMDAFVRSDCRTTYHYSSTCRMAPEDEAGVVNDELKVYGVQGLRVADSSIFPHILSTHLVAGTVALAEKCADMIRRDSVGDILEA